MAELTLHKGSYDAVPAAVGVARRAVERAAVAAGIDADVVSRIVLGLSEAATNAVLHAYDDRARGAFHVSVVLDGDVTLTVADDGTGVRPRPHSPGLGVGMPLMAGVSDECAIGRGPTGGAVVTMRFAA